MLHRCVPTASTGQPRPHAYCCWWSSATGSLRHACHPSCARPGSGWMSSAARAASSRSHASSTGRSSSTAAEAEYFAAVQQFLATPSRPLRAGSSRSPTPMFADSRAASTSPGCRLSSRPARPREVVEALLDKPAMDRLLGRAGVTLPAVGARCRRRPNSSRSADAYGWPVMLKPVDGVGGGGVTRVRAAEHGDVVAHGAWTSLSGSSWRRHSCRDRSHRARWCSTTAARSPGPLPTRCAPGRVRTGRRRRSASRRFPAWPSCCRSSARRWDSTARSRST